MQVDSNFFMKIYTEKQKDGIKHRDYPIYGSAIRSSSVHALNLISPVVFVIFSWKLELILLADGIFLLFTVACILAILCH